MHARPAPASAANCSLCYSVAGKRHTTLLQAGEVQPSLQLGFPYTGKIAGGGADLWGGAACSGTQAPHISITCSGSGYMQEQVPHCPPSAADPSSSFWLVSSSPPPEMRLQDLQPRLQCQCMLTAYDGAILFQCFTS